MNAKNILFASFLSVASFAGSAALADVSYETVQVGGTGGDEFLDASCRGGWLKGFKLRTGRVVDRIGTACTDETAQRVEYSNVWYGGTGGNAVNTTCKSGYVVKGVVGRSARLIDRVALRCVKASQVNPEEIVGETIDANYPAYGGNGGDYFSLGCAAGDAAVGIHGAATQRVDRLGLLCRDVAN